MNLLKALAKMTRYAEWLERSKDVLQAEHTALREKYDDTVRISTDRDSLVKQLQAKLHAAEQNTASNQQLTAVNKLNDLGYVWSIPDGRWFDPVPKPPIGVPVPSLPQPVEFEQASQDFARAAPPKPEGLGWRSSEKTPPRNMSDVVDTVLFNGNSVTCPAAQLTWDPSSSVGVAWWRYPR